MINVTSADQNVALNAPILFDITSIPSSGSIKPTSPGIVTLQGPGCGNPQPFAQYIVALSANVQIPTGGTVTPIALALTLDGEVLPESFAIHTPDAVEEYEHIYTETTVRVPRGCCFNVAARYVDATADDPTIVGTPSITVRRGASIRVDRTA